MFVPSGTASTQLAHGSVFDECHVSVIKIAISPENYTNMLQSRRVITRDTVHHWVPVTATINGVVLSNTAMRIKGNNSLGTTSGLSIPYKLDFNRFVPGQALHGITMLNLHSFASSPLELSDFLSYGAFRAERVPAPRTGWAEVWLNERNLGTYTLVEQVNDSFIKRHFDFTQGHLYKPELPSGRLLWSGANITNYPTINPETHEQSDHRALLHFLDVVNHRPVEEFSTVLDLGLTHAYLGGNAALGNTDAYSEGGHNYYLYESSPGKFGFLPWDMNLSQEKVSLIPVARGKAFTEKLLRDPIQQEIYFRFVQKFLAGAGSESALNGRIDAALLVLSNRIDAAAIQTLRGNIHVRTQVLYTELFRRIATSPFSPVTINEVLASNNGAARDDFGEFDDYIELYNKSDAPVDLGGMYLSDDLDKPRKFQFAAGTIIPPRGYLPLWADEDLAQGPSHLPFKLSAAGETVILSETDARANLPIDQLSFGRQIDDIAEGRVEGFQMALTPTPGAANQWDDADDDKMPDLWERAFGLNPATDDASLDLDADGISNLQEFIRASNPLQPLFPPVLTFTDYNEDTRRILTLSWTPDESVVDLLDSASSPEGPWQPLRGFRGGTNYAQLIKPAENHFYRVRRFKRP